MNTVNTLDNKYFIVFQYLFFFAHLTLFWLNLIPNHLNRFFFCILFSDLPN